MLNYWFRKSDSLEGLSSEVWHCQKKGNKSLCGYPYPSDEEYHDSIPDINGVPSPFCWKCRILSWFLRFKP